MQVHFMSNDFSLTSPLRDHLSKRLRHAFVPIQDRIGAISIRLRDLNGPKGGRDMLCQVAVVMPGRPPLLVRDTREDMYTAIDSAIKRAAYRATQLISKQRQTIRKIPSPKMQADADSDQHS